MFRKLSIRRQLSHAGLADTYGLLGAGTSRDDATAKAKAAATRALELDGGPEFYAHRR